MHVATDPNEQVLPVIQDRLPEVIAHEARIATKQGILWKNKALQQVREVVPLAGGGRAQLPAPRHPQAHVPDQRQPDLRLDAFGERLAAASLVTPFLSRLRLAATSIVRGRKGCFIAPSARRGGP